MKKARCETCGVLVDAELTHNGVCMVGHYGHCGWGHEVAPNELVSEYDIVAALERIAIMAEISSHHTPDGTMRLMPAEGVADVIYEAMHTIVDLRIDLEVALEDATEAETFAEELLDAEDPKAKALAMLERIAKHDHQGLAAQVLRCPPSGSVERTKAYADVLSEVASTDIQSWARDAIRKLKGEDQ